MIDLLDVSLYPRPVPAGRCFCCWRRPSRTDGKLNGQFRGIIGDDWPGGLVSYNLRKDFATLGLVAEIPERAWLCLRCAVAYMESFNVLLTAQKQRRDGAEPVGLGQTELRLCGDGRVEGCERDEA